MSDLTGDEVDEVREYYLGELDKKDAEIERLRAALRSVRVYIKDCDHEPAVDEIDSALEGK